MPFIVTIENTLHGVTEKWPLRGTTWSFSMDRATRHATRQEAEAALAAARPFMRAAAFKKAKIEEVE